MYKEFDSFCFIICVLDSESEQETSVVKQLHESDEESAKDSPVVIENFPEVQIGSLYEKSIPINYCARFLAYNFLLSGNI